MRKYFVSFVCDGTFGNTVLTINTKIDSEDKITEVSNTIRKKINRPQKVIIINFLEMD